MFATFDFEALQHVLRAALRGQVGLWGMYLFEEWKGDMEVRNETYHYQIKIAKIVSSSPCQALFISCTEYSVSLRFFILSRLYINSNHVLYSVNFVNTEFPTDKPSR